MYKTLLNLYGLAIFILEIHYDDDFFEEMS